MDDDRGLRRGLSTWDSSIDRDVVFARMVRFRDAARAYQRLHKNGCWDVDKDGPHPDTLMAVAEHLEDSSQ